MTQTLFIKYLFFAMASLFIIYLARDVMALSPTASHHAATEYLGQSHVSAEVIRIVDGDTLQVLAMVWANQYIQSYVRINGIDTPEIKGKCEKERAYLDKPISKDRQVILRNIHNGKYAGRVVADLYTASGEDIASAMLKKSFARPYHGKKRQPWL